MASILIVEDDEFKRENIAECISEYDGGLDLIFARSISSALRTIEETADLSLVVLDMSLPTYDVGPNESGGRPQGFGGLTVMQHIDGIGRELSVLVVTQFLSFEQGDQVLVVEDLTSLLGAEFPHLFSGLIQYSGGSSSWRDELVSHLRKGATSA